METAERLQHRINTLGELHGIVRTMKVLSAVSVRPYERAVQALADYYRTVELGLQVVLQDMDSLPSLVHCRRETHRLAAIVFGSDHGLCGRFNEDITSYAMQRMEASAGSAKGRRLVAVGSRIATNLDQYGQLIEGAFRAPASVTRITTTVQQVLRKIDQWRSEGDTRYVYLFFNSHLSGGGHRPTGIELLPVNLHRFQRLEAKPWLSRRLPIFTMDRKHLLAALLRQYFFVSIFRACAESQASEHASRLTAMQSAEKNLNERLEEVTTLFRRLRQESITTEMLDVVSGFEAVMAGDYQ